MKQSKYIVWVGSTPNYFNTMKEAIKEQSFWLSYGYDNIVIEIE
jgi:hypothetical protein